LIVVLLAILSHFIFVTMLAIAITFGTFLSVASMSFIIPVMYFCSIAVIAGLSNVMEKITRKLINRAGARNSFRDIFILKRDLHQSLLEQESTSQIQDTLSQQSEPEPEAEPESEVQLLRARLLALMVQRAFIPEQRSSVSEQQPSISAEHKTPPKRQPTNTERYDALLEKIEQLPKSDRCDALREGVEKMVDESDVDDGFCYKNPITQELIDDPVTLVSTGQTYDRGSLIEHMTESSISMRNKCPFTRRPLRATVEDVLKMEVTFFVQNQIRSQLTKYERRLGVLQKQEIPAVEVDTDSIMEEDVSPRCQ